MLLGIVIGAAFVVALLMLSDLGQHDRRQYWQFSIVGMAIAVAVAAIVVQRVAVEDGADANRVDSLGGISVSQLARATAQLQGTTPSAAQAGKVASVPSLIRGLEARLGSNPSDMRGWSLLAQSFAFVGDFDSAESALMRAVELGADEADLRSRVEGARRDPHAGLPEFASVR